MGAVDGVAASGRPRGESPLAAGAPMRVGRTGEGE